MDKNNKPKKCWACNEKTLFFTCPDCEKAIYCQRCLSKKDSYCCLCEILQMGKWENGRKKGTRESAFRKDRFLKNKPKL